MRKERQEAIAIDLLLFSSLEAVAEKNHMSKSALYNLRKKEEFQAIFSDQRRRLFGEASAKLQGYALEGVEQLMEIVRSPMAQDANKINAIRILLDNSKGAYEREEVIPKLEELERQLDAMKEE